MRRHEIIDIIADDLESILINGTATTVKKFDTMENPSGDKLPIINLSTYTEGYETIDSRTSTQHYHSAFELNIEIYLKPKPDYEGFKLLEDTQYEIIDSLSKISGITDKTHKNNWLELVSFESATVSDELNDSLICRAILKVKISYKLRFE